MASSFIPFFGMKVNSFFLVLLQGIGLNCLCSPVNIKDSASFPETREDLSGDKILFFEDGLVNHKIKTWPRTCLENLGLESRSYYFHEESEQCHLIGTRGPCGKNMNFQPAPDAENGACICAEASNGQTLVYHQRSNQCFPVFSQGPCTHDKWIVLEDETFQCRQNLCSSIQLPDSDIIERKFPLVIFNNRCVSLASSAAECEVSETVQFIPGEVFPKCQPSLDDPSRVGDSDYAIGAIARKCPKGTSRARNGKCVKAFIW